MNLAEMERRATILRPARVRHWLDLSEAAGPGAPTAMDFPGPRWPPLNTITPFHTDAFGATLATSGSALFLTDAASAAWGTPNLVVYHPFKVSEAAVAKKMSHIVGATASGNADIGIYDSQKNLLVSSGSTAQGSTNTLQEFDITDTLLAPGRYFMALTLSSGTGTAWSVNLIDEIVFVTTPMYVQTPGGFGLPATATFAKSTAASPIYVAMAVHFDTLV